ncbi:20 kDa chaperonin, chloroplastic-like protein [Tanacetum coccineum]
MPHRRNPASTAYDRLLRISIAGISTPKGCPSPGSNVPLAGVPSKNTRAVMYPLQVSPSRTPVCAQLAQIIRYFNILQGSGVDFVYTSLKPLGDRVLTKIKAAEEKSIGGILLPSTSQTKLQGGEVVVVGEGRTIGDKKIDIGVKVEEAEETNCWWLIAYTSKQGDTLYWHGDAWPGPLNEEGVRTMDSISSKK